MERDESSRECEKEIMRCVRALLSSVFLLFLKIKNKKY
jgi:hypothetical protein